MNGIDAHALLLAAPIVLLIGVDKGGFAGAFGPLAVPLLALVLPPVEAAGLLLPVLLAMDAYGLWAYRGAFDGRALRLLVPAGLVGVLAGALCGTALVASEARLRLCLGALALVFAAAALWSFTRAAHERSRPRGAIFGAACGALAGIGSFVAHAGGPPLQMYLLAERSTWRARVATSVVFFAVMNVAKVAPYAALGFLDAQRALTAAALVPAGAVGVAIGRALVERVDGARLAKATTVILLFAGARLVWEGLLGSS